jgi:hypothetical protein
MRGMTRHLALTYKPADAPPEEPLTFSIRDSEPFTAIDGVPGITLLKMASLSEEATDGDGNPSANPEQLKMMYELITGVVIKSDSDRFITLLEEAQPPIDGNELMHYYNQLVGELTGRPTEGLSPSSGGQPETLTGSTGNTEETVETPPGGSAL